ncbi:MAG TPA: ABC transporter permease [Bryobacteraceae bacterium]|nr:ABC transporter permease [Bryobacteraceae bacterium]
MSLLAKVSTILHGAFRRKRMEQDMDAELRFHVARYTEDLIRSGVAKEEAERRARIEFGHIEPLKEECRQARGLRLLDETGQDLRYAGRMLRKAPGFAAVAVVTLALGIGANTSIFSVLNTFVLKPLPYANPDRLLAIWSVDEKGRWRSGVAPADLYDWRRDSPVFEQICAWRNPPYTLQQQGSNPEQLVGGQVSAEFFKMLGVAPQLGRDFLPQEDSPGAPRVAILSNDLWRSHFAGDPAMIGKSIQIDGEAATVVGIAPPGFHLPLMGKAMLWMPFALSAEDRANRRRGYLGVIARMKPGVSVSRATMFLKTLAGRMQETYPATNRGRTVQMRTLRDEIGMQGAKDPTVILFGLVGCVLLIACSNVANLIVGRAVGRQKEMAVRLAIGAGRARLLRQLLTENLVLFLMAGALSVLFALWGIRWIADSIPLQIRDYLPNSGALRVDLPTLLYTLAIALLSGLVFGFAPAFHCWRMDVNHGLKESGSRGSAGGSASRLKNCLIVLETSLALVVLVASGLLVKGMVKMYASENGLNPHGLITARIFLSDPKYADPKKDRAFTKAVLEQLSILPGVESAALAMYFPYSGNNGAARYAIEGRTAPAPAEQSIMMFDAVSTDYFNTMGIPLLRGRVFSEQDRPDSVPVALINQTMAQRNWPGEDPVGKRIRWGTNLDRTLTVVGVVKDNGGIDETGMPHPQTFLAAEQFPMRGMTVALRTRSDSVDVAAGIRRAVQAVDGSQAVLRIQTMEELMAEQQAQFSVVGQVTSFFALLSLFLAALGIYGVMAYSVAARTQEFGIRLALGAGRGTLAGMVLRQGMKLTLLGLAIGLAGAFGVTRLMSSILYQVSPNDVPTFTGISALLLVVAVLACYLPARRASSIEPTRALRCE